MKKLTMIPRALALMLVVITMITVLPTTALAVNYDNPNATENFIVENGVLTQYLGAGYDLHVVVPNDVTEIGDLAFTNHAGIVSVTLPDSVQKIGMAVFYGCDNLTDIYLGSGLQWMPTVDHKYVHSDSFTGLVGLQAYHVSASNPYFKDVDGVLFTADGELVRYPQGRTGDYNVPDGTVKIRSMAFAGVTGIGTLTIPGSVEEIVVNTFCNGTFGTIVIEDGVRKLNDGAFRYCMSRNYVIPPSVTEIGLNIFADCDNFTVYGQAGSTNEAYCKANNLTFSTTDPLDPVAPNLNTASAWARDGIQEAYDRGFVPVYLLDNYTTVITRAEFCRLAMKYVRWYTGKTEHELYELAENPSYLRGNLFSDVADLAVNRDILYAYALGIINGTKAPTATEPGTFDPEGTLTREQAATMIMNTCRVLGKDVDNVSQAGFADMDTVSSWAVDGVNFVRSEGIMNGTGNDNFSPKGTYTRQESIVTFDRIK